MFEQVGILILNLVPVHTSSKKRNYLQVDARNKVKYSMLRNYEDVMYDTWIINLFDVFLFPNYTCPVGEKEEHSRIAYLNSVSIRCIVNCLRSCLNGSRRYNATKEED